ncbi:MAG: LacI family DNA-binding transcriptional regulator [Verrucomicrobiota bacterium]|nr:LacI family DNA-binding transcriptional regulator [Verrucomicrobiota bacterium]
MTIREIAEKAGVSTATVSRMINENGFVSTETRKKIQATIEETGYDPSLRKRRKESGLSSQLKHRNIAMLWTGGNDPQLTNTGQSMMLGITEALRQIGGSLTVDYIDSTEHIPQILMDGKLDGVLIHGPTPSPSICEHLEKIPVIWLLQAGSVDFGDRVQPDHAFAGKTACEHLIQQGCRNLCCMSHTPPATHSPYWKSRADHFSRHADLNNIHCTLLDLPEPTISETKPSEDRDSAKKLVDSFMQLSPKPDGLFVANNLGVHIHAELLNRGIVPMKNLPMIAGDANVCAQHMDPEPIKIRVFSQQIGRLAVESLLLRIRTPDMPLLTHSLKPKLILPE